MSDRRLTPANAQVAHIALKGVVEADRFVQPVRRRIAADVVDLISANNKLERQILFGEGFEVLDSNQDWTFGISGRDGYVGYIETRYLQDWEEPTHRVSALSTIGLAGPDFKSGATEFLSMGSRLRIVDAKGSFLLTSDQFWVPERHLCAICEYQADPVSIASKFLDVPYLWGGNSSRGIDCSGLVQAALLACGIACPGDSDQQEAAFSDASGPYQSGDLLFWKGHVAMVVDPDRVIHANAHHMAVACEDLTETMTRIEAHGGGPVTSHKRPAERRTDV